MYKRQVRRFRTTLANTRRRSGTYQPEGDPGAHDNDGEGDVELEDVEADRPVELELEVDHRPVPVLDVLDPGTVAPVGHQVLGHAHGVDAERRRGPLVTTAWTMSGWKGPLYYLYY